MKKLLYIILLCVLALSLFGFKSCSKSKKFIDNFRNNAPIELPQLPTANEYTSEKGVIVATVDAIPADAQPLVLSLIDTAVTRLLAKTKNFNPANAITYNDYRVLMIPPTYHTQSGNCPALTMKSGITVAGTVVGIGQIEPPLIVIAENYNVSNECNQYLINATEYESEHRIICANREIFRVGDVSACDYFVGGFDKHPIISDDGKLNY